MEVKELPNSPAVASSATAATQSSNALMLAHAVQRRLLQQGQTVSVTDLVERMGLAGASGDGEQDRGGRSQEGRALRALEAPILQKLRVMPLQIRDDALLYASVRKLVEAEERELLAQAKNSGYVVSRCVAVPKSRGEVISWLQQLSFVDSEVLEREAEALCRDTYNAQLVGRFVDHVFQDAVQSRASDVHFERADDSAYCWISFRVDGTLQRRLPLIPRAMSAICTRMKTMAGLDISELSQAQDGRLGLRINGRLVDLRISSVPRYDGETIAVRILDQSKVQRLIELYARHPVELRRMRALATVRGKSGGIVLVTGPTGQGKSTTLSAFLMEMRRTDIKIMTIEDPVETRIPFAHQSSITATAGNSYANLLRAFMRQDPDVLMVGEIRDSETAREFVRGAETGHLMLSTLHTNDAPGALNRLLTLLPDEMRSSAIFTLASSLRAVVNQRLIPRLCECARAIAQEGDQVARLARLLNVTPEALRQSRVRERVGCRVCAASGYRGREVVLESMFFENRGGQSLASLMRQLEHNTADGFKTCAGVTHIPRRHSVRRLWLAGVVDAVSAEAALATGGARA